ncbi:unnamed protein product, partial [Tetraodon nigroviridis]
RVQTVVYCTRSVYPEENEQLVKRVLEKTHTHPKLLPFSRTPRRSSRSRTCWQGRRRRASWVESLLRNRKRAKRKNAERITRTHLTANHHPLPATTGRQEMSSRTTEIQVLPEDVMKREVRMNRRKGKGERRRGPKGVG